MSLNITVIAGYTFPAGVPFSLAALRRAALPTVSISASVGPGDLAPGAVTKAAVAPDAYWYGLDTGVANAAVVSLSPAVSAYADGLLVAVKILFPNTGPSTLAVNGLAPATVKKNGNVDLQPGDWQAGQIVALRYQLDANVIPAGVSYAPTTYVAAVTKGRNYTYTPGANDTNLANGAQTLTGAGVFTAVGSTVTLTGLSGLVITATLIPVSNVWQMLSQLGNPVATPAPFLPASAYLSGEQGLVPRPKAGQQGFVLRGDGTWFDVLTLANQAAGAPYLEILKAFNFS